MLRTVEFLMEKGPSKAVNMTRVLECLGMENIGEDFSCSSAKSDYLKRPRLQGFRGLVS